MHKLLLLAGVTGIVSVASAQELVVPANRHWSSPFSDSGSTSTTSGFRTTQFRTQLIYDNTHFTNNGVTGPISINRLRFRVEDGERNPGGHVYTAVTVRLSDAAATVTTNFATNVGANVGLPEVVPAIVLGAASGTVPNDYVIDIQLTVGAFTYDPTTMGKLLIELTCPTGPVPTTGLPPMTATATTDMAQMVHAATALATTGTLTSTALVCWISFTGTGGYPAIVPADKELYGAACAGATTSFYQFFARSDVFDLGGPNKSLLLTPDSATAPTNYMVTAGTTAVDLNFLQATPNTGDDTTITHPLPYTFLFPGGSTATISPSCNGFVWLESRTTTDFSPTVAEFLGNGTSNLPGRLAPVWHDWHCGRNTTSHPNSGMHVVTTGPAGNTVTYITWLNVGEFNTVSTLQGVSVNTFQCVIDEQAMTVEYRYGQMDGALWGHALTGFGRGSQGGGTNAADPGQRDLSHEVPFTTTGPDGASSMTYDSNARPILGTTITLTASNIPAGVQIGVHVAGVGTVRPGTPLTAGAPGCQQNINADVVLSIDIAPAGTGSEQIVVPNNSNLLGLVVGAQYVAFGAQNELFSSNAVELVVGLN